MSIIKKFHPTYAVLVIAIVAGLGFVALGWSGNSASAEVAPKPAPPVTSTTFPEVPNTTTPPPPDIRTIQVTAWGTKVINQAKSLSLQARGTEPGDTPETVQVNFDLCALKDTAISDTESMGSYDITVDTLRFPEDGILDSNDPSGGYEDYSLPGAIIVDNTPMVNQILTENSKPGDPVYGEAGDLVSVLRKGTCTTASVEVKRSDRNKMVFGFIYWTIPFGELRIGGGVTQLGEDGPATIRYLYEIN